MAISLKSTVAAPVAAYPALKASIVLFDCNPGTRNWTVPEGVSKIRAFVVGAGGGGQLSQAGYSGGGGGYSEKTISVTPGQVISYTVADGGAMGLAGGTSAFAGTISATGGTAAVSAVNGVGGEGQGGDINTSGGTRATSVGPGHAYGAGGALFGVSSGRARVDGWKIGMLPGFFGYGEEATPLGELGRGGTSGAGGRGAVGIEVIA